MTDSPRWERESQEDLRLSDPQPHADVQPQDTVEFDIRRAGFGPDELAEPPEYVSGMSDEDDDEADWPARAPRLTAARESLAATRGSVAQSLSVGRQSVATTAGRAGRWFAALDRRPEFAAGEDDHDPLAQLTMPIGRRSTPAPTAAGVPEMGDTNATVSDEVTTTGPAADVIAEDRQVTGRPDPADEDGPRFPTAALGYNRQAVDAHVALLEAELARLRQAVDPPMSITEEIERLGEQTASILVVAHDKAHETARRAQQQAARAVSEAADDAERITTEAQRRLRELDEETDAVWRERERLLDDVREVSRTLATLADAASERFPAAGELVTASVPAGRPAEERPTDDEDDESGPQTA